MIILYKLLINVVFFVSPLIVIFRIIKRKEHIKRVKEKFCFFSKNRGDGKIIWFHGASVGELQSIVPILEKLETNKNIKKILVTSNTLSSSRIIQKFKFKKIIHQFFPVDTNFLSKKFINYWKPSLVVFIDSEIWPNMLKNLKQKNIPTVLLNGRITKKTFRRWKIFPKFAQEIFCKFDLCLSSSNESKQYLFKLGAKRVRYIGNLKFSQSEYEKISIPIKLKKFISSKKTWCASSTHLSEENFCGAVHKELRLKYKDLLTIIIPRHIDRSEAIGKELSKLDLKVQFDSSISKIDPKTDVYIVNSYGKTKSFYNICQNVFLGGSLIKHGGQNPLEATRYGCKVIHGPNVSNFTEIYQLLKKKKVSIEIRNQKQMINALSYFFSKKSNTKKSEKHLKFLGKQILNKTYKEINRFIK